MSSANVHYALAVGARCTQAMPFTCVVLFIHYYLPLSLCVLRSTLLLRFISKDGDSTETTRLTDVLTYISLYITQVRRRTLMSKGKHYELCNTTIKFIVHISYSILSIVFYCAYITDIRDNLCKL